jgi:uracil-DNA glycosylase
MTASSLKSDETLDEFTARIRQCRLCRDEPLGSPLAHEPRPVVRVSATARLLIAGQAPGVRVHASGIPFDDPSGERLRQWMGVDRDTFYDDRRISIAPMGFCFPGWDNNKGDLPPRRECRANWHDQLFAHLPQVDTILAIGIYAQDYHFARLALPRRKGEGMTDVVRRFADFGAGRPRVIPLPHPSWRNSGWLKKNPWFETDLLPVLRRAVSDALL